MLAGALVSQHFVEFALNTKFTDKSESIIPSPKERQTLY